MQPDFLPHAINSEQSVLGAILLRPDRISDLLALEPEHFYLEAHQEIYREMRRMSMLGRHIDVITLAEALSAAGKDEASGGLAYLGSLVEATPSAANLLRYAEIVQAKASERAMIAAAGDIIAIAKGAGDISEKVERAQSLMMEISAARVKKDFRSVGDAMPDYLALMARRDAGECVGISTGIPELDRQMGAGMQDGHLIIAAGRPSMGKSAFMNTIAVNVAEQGVPVGLFSMEMEEYEQIDRAIAFIGRVPLDEVIRCNLGGDYGAHIQRAFERLSTLPYYIDEEGGLSIHALISKARRAKQRHGIRLFIVDALGLMRHNADKAASQLGEITRALKAFAKEIKCPIILLCQLNRKVEERADKRPIMSDLRDSGSIEQDADVVMMLYRAAYYYSEIIPDDQRDICEVIFRKVRQGKLGTVPMLFKGENARFVALAGDWSPWSPSAGVGGYQSNSGGGRRRSLDD